MKNCEKSKEIIISFTEFSQKEKEEKKYFLYKLLKKSRKKIVILDMEFQEKEIKNFEEDFYLLFSYLDRKTLIIRNSTDEIFNNIRKLQVYYELLQKK